MKVIHEFTRIHTNISEDSRRFADSPEIIMRETRCDILIAGGGTGGCAAAMGAASLGKRVVMTEETDWIGGQLTAQAVELVKQVV